MPLPPGDLRPALPTSSAFSRVFIRSHSDSPASIATTPPVQPSLIRSTALCEKLGLANRHGGGSVLGVSTTEIIQELPKLSQAERRTVRRVLSDLAAKEEDVQLCNQVATEAAMMSDRMEEEDARRQQG